MVAGESSVAFVGAAELVSELVVTELGRWKPLQKPRTFERETPLAVGSRRARYVVVVSQSNRNFDHFRRSIVVYDVS